MKGQLTSYDCQFFWLEVETIEAGKSASKLCAFLGDGAFKLNQSCKKKQLMLKLKAKLVQVLGFFFVFVHNLLQSLIYRTHKPFPFRREPNVFVFNTMHHHAVFKKGQEAAWIEYQNISLK